MRVKYLIFANPLFPPEILPGGVMCHNLVKEFVSRNYDLTVLTGFPNRPYGIVFPGYRRKIRHVSYQEGFRLIRCWTWLIGKNYGGLNRLLENISFGFTGAINLFFQNNADLLVIDAWPSFCTFFLSAAARIKGIPCYYYVQDLLPEQAENTGMIKRGGLISRLMMWFDEKACANCAGLFTLSDGMSKYVSETRNIDATKIITLPIQVDEVAVHPLPRNNSWRASNNISDDQFVVVFTGTMGHVSGISILNQIAPLFTANDKVLFVCIGEGALKSQLEITSKAFPHLRVLPFQSDNDYLLALGAADVALLTMGAGCGVASVPSKMYTYMAAEKPILTNAPADSESVRLINTIGCGLWVNPDDPTGLEKVIRCIRDNPQLIAGMGKAGREYILNYCTVEKIADKMETFWSSTL